MNLTSYLVEDVCALLSNGRNGVASFLEECCGRVSLKGRASPLLPYPPPHHIIDEETQKPGRRPAIRVH